MQTLETGAPSVRKESSRSLLAYVGAAIALGAVVFHLMGFISHDTYLSRQDVDDGPFGKSPDELVMGLFLAYSHLRERHRLLRFVLVPLAIRHLLCRHRYRRLRLSSDAVESVQTCGLGTSEGCPCH